jgi:cytochrome c-type biogenesis protein CcmH
VRRVAALGAVAAALLSGPSALAADCPKTTLGDVEDEVMCPACGTPLALATEAPQAQRERELVQRLIARCKSKDEIKSALAAEFGDSVLAVPDDEGFDLAAYLVPALAILLGAGAVGAAARRWRRRRGAGGPRPASPGGEAARLDADIERYDL